jgi:hypothetical protein
MDTEKSDTKKYGIQKNLLSKTPLFRACPYFEHSHLEKLKFKKLSSYGIQRPAEDILTLLKVTISNVRAAFYIHQRYFFKVIDLAVCVSLLNMVI